MSGSAVILSNTLSATITLSNLLQGTYVFGLTVTDNDGATGYDEVLVEVTESILIELGAHKIFSPDGNGIDDYWEIENLEIIQGCQLAVFNRFGLTVYESSDYQNNWDGTYNGNPLPEADYYFVLKCEENSKSTSGGIRIIRDY